MWAGYGTFNSSLFRWQNAGSLSGPQALCGRFPTPVWFHLLLFPESFLPPHVPAVLHKRHTLPPWRLVLAAPPPGIHIPNIPHGFLQFLQVKYRPTLKYFCIIHQNAIFFFMIKKKTLNCSYPPQEFHSIKNRICFFHFVHCCIHPLRLRLPMSPLQFETHRPVIRSSDSSLQHLVPSTMPQSLFDVGHYS